jgi:FkbM family methyltransferase
MSGIIETADRWATKLGVRPIAAYVYRLLKNVKDSIRYIDYKQHRLRSDTYQVTVGDAQADFYVLTRQEYEDFTRLPEQSILKDLLSQLQSDDVFYDIGANLGLYSCLVSDVVEPTVVAFDPHPKNVDRLEQNASLNESNISIQRLALAASSGLTQLRLSPGFDLDDLGSAGHTLLTDFYDEESDTITVEKKRGDEFVAEGDLPPPTVLKIDTEGTEMSVLEGFNSTLARPECRLVYCEVHENRLHSQGYSVSDVYNLLESHGFSVEERSVRDYQTFIRGRKD